ncbi:hypothetical protein [Evansella cellulosilytica]|uniref:Oligoendopeptidase F n=1 Tax=Evansella cellulosilytica (strain ATCC 21833 / DSM 2522 / FERM P-1141 / JCM 9156 / N-4) TaxID=649639 RepID=E6TRW2_EVAC2|nr:hypothetical protein [Evansella cellulosilytica]ADU29485.1 oligoendopeptidase F [Evansella cellulosilytica DSM 2522]
MTINPIIEKPIPTEQEEQLKILFYLADTLGYSMDEYFYTFDSVHYERWVIAERLYPILEEEYELKNTVEISDKYRMEVIDEIIKTHF